MLVRSPNNAIFAVMRPITEQQAKLLCRIHKHELAGITFTVEEICTYSGYKDLYKLIKKWREHGLVQRASIDTAFPFMLTEMGKEIVRNCHQGRGMNWEDATNDEETQQHIRDLIDGLMPKEIFDDLLVNGDQSVDALHKKYAPKIKKASFLKHISKLTKVKAVGKHGEMIRVNARIAFPFRSIAV